MADEGGAAPGSYRQVLRNRQFLALMVAQIVALVGQSVALVALAVLIFQRTGSPLLSALTFALSFAPYLVGGLLSPRVEHVPARRLLVACDLFQGGSFLLLAVPGLPVLVLLALLTVGSVVSPVYTGTRAALLPDLLGSGEGFVLGRSILRLISQVGQILGLALGGALLLAVPASGVLLLVAAAFVASALVVRFRIGQHPPVAVDPDVAAGDAGLQVVFTHAARRRLLILMWLVAAVSVAPEALAVPYVTELGRPAGSAGLLLWAAPAGIVVFELLTVRLLDATQRVRYVNLLALLVLVVPWGFALQPPLVGAAVLLFCCGAGSGYTLGLDQLLLDATPTHLRRRVLSAASAGLMFWQGIGFAVAGAGAEFAPPRVVIPVLALAGLAGSALVLRPARPRLARG